MPPLETSVSITQLVPALKQRHSIDSSGSAELTSPGGSPELQRRKHPAISTVLSESPTKPRKKFSIALSSTSASTLIADHPGLVTPAETVKEPPKMGVEDFLNALNGFVPVSLRGLPMHSSGSVDFSDVGGLEKAKHMLRETLLWPSKVSDDVMG